MILLQCNHAYDKRDISQKSFGEPMIPWKMLDSAQVPGDGQEMSLQSRGEEFSIRVDGQELMNSRTHGSEDALAEFACAAIKNSSVARILIGGLGMGFTTRAALKMLNRRAQIVVAELVPAVVQWNMTHLAHLAGEPLKDKRVSVREQDVAQILRTAHAAYDAILLDVDNGPEGLTHAGNDWLYSAAGLLAAKDALRPTGVLAVWSAGESQAFKKRMQKVGFRVKQHRAHARGASGGSRHTIWVATR